MTLDLLRAMVLLCLNHELLVKEKNEGVHREKQRQDNIPSVLESLVPIVPGSNYIQHLPSLRAMRYLWVCVKWLQSCPTLREPIDWSPPGFSVHEIYQATILEWVATPSSRRSSRSGNLTHVSCVSCLDRRVLYTSTTWEDTSNNSLTFSPRI